jgi:hypothetical protein
VIIFTKTFNLLDHKGLYGAFLSRINIVNPTPKVFQAPNKYGINWTLKSTEQVIAMHDKFVQLARQQENYGPFRAVASLVGVQSAVQLARMGEYEYPRNLRIQ